MPKVTRLARSELELVMDMYHYGADEIEPDETPSLNSEDPDKRMFTIREPHGVYGVITPWNFPNNDPFGVHRFRARSRYHYCPGPGPDYIGYLDESG